jgi:hypothetical protein
MAPTRVQIENAIHEWITQATELPAEQVMWSRQKAPQPTRPYVDMVINRSRSPGTDWLSIDDNPGGDAGEEIKYQQRGSRILTLSLRCFGTDPTGTSEPLEILEKIRDSHLLPSTHDALATVGVGVGAMSDVTALEMIIQSTIIEPRAMMTIELHVARERTSLGTFIETVEVEGTVT